MLPEGPIPYTKIVYLPNDGSMVPTPGGPKIVTRYDFLEDECEGILEVKGNTMIYTGLVRKAVEVDGIPVSTTVTYMTLEQENIPIQTIMRAFVASQASTSGIPKD
ncbi:hypothetical protein TSUD_158910 [Trifolium subterraneum]|uniref:Uncharacterized protein n=1 Tax=Trifolium subterraneum TaxID=3900 RepID=A0A2Z6NRS6_TRISU|nr:hypothetical protein TSUD_158910 [Trifolium subterraneum]